MDSSSTATPYPSASTAGATPVQKTPSSSSNADRLAELEVAVVQLTDRLNRSGKFSQRMDVEVTSIGKNVADLSHRVAKLERTMAEHLITDNQWWRSCIVSIIEDIDSIRKTKANDRSPATGC